MGRSTVSRRASEFVGVALFAVALIWIVALASYEPGDPVWFFSTDAHLAPANFAGRIGAFLAELSFQLFGYASYLIPAAMLIVGWNYFWCRWLDASGTKATGAALLVGCISGFLSLIFGTISVSGKPFRAGGYAGEFLASRMSDYLNRTGSAIVLVTLIFLAIIMSTQFSFGRFFAALMGALHRRATRGVDAFHERREERRREKQRQEVIAKHTRKSGADAPVPKVTLPGVAATIRPVKERETRAEEADGGADGIAARASRAVANAFKRSGSDERPVQSNAPMPQAPAPAPPDPVISQAGPALYGPKSFAPPRPPKVVSPPLPLSDPEPALKAPAERRKGDYTLPPAALLDAVKTERKIDERELMDAARLLEEKCREFSVEGSVVQIHPGPVVTTYEFKPDAGVKYSKITGLADDLCLAMKADSVLIDRIAGKSTVGIQIPNHTREQISLRDLLESDAYKRSTSKLTIALGKTIHGEPYMADLATMPHLLIAGSTGAGKSVSMNGMLTSILYRASPDDVRLILIDPKRLELGMYEEIPHLMTPVVDPKQAANALRLAVREMEERYKTLAAEACATSSITATCARRSRKRDAEGRAGAGPLPFIIVVIDELADLMMVASNEVEESIARLAQMARAVGIHLILATQRPSVDVITGLIKANLPARIAFRVASKIDSRTILDGNGAEQLLGKGDMLFLPPASSRFIRVHAPYISEQESARLASFLRKQGKPVYDTSITAEEKSAADGPEMEKDDLYDEAARIVVQSGQASISYLQRRLRVGFSRAARLVDMMEMEGLVSPAAGGKPREVLVDKHYFEEVDSQLR